jgi:hypothetical protein
LFLLKHTLIPFACYGQRKNTANGFAIGPAFDVRSITPADIPEQIGVQSIHSIEIIVPDTSCPPALLIVHFFVVP